MKFFKPLLKGIGILFLLPVLYIFFSLLLTFIPAGQEKTNCPSQYETFLSSNGVHLDLILPAEFLSNDLKKGLYLSEDDKYYSFGWGDKNFYINTPTWADLTLKNSFIALFTFSESAMHVTRFTRRQKQWKTLKLCDQQLRELNQYINRRFSTNSSTGKVHIDHPGYGPKDEFYEANGSFTFLFTCNTWVNSGLKDIGMPACLWTPFDFWLISKYE